MSLGSRIVNYYLPRSIFALLLMEKVAEDSSTGAAGAAEKTTSVQSNRRRRPRKQKSPIDAGGSEIATISTTIEENTVGKSSEKALEPRLIPSVIVARRMRSEGESKEAQLELAKQGTVTVPTAIPSVGTDVSVKKNGARRKKGSASIISAQAQDEITRTLNASAASFVPGTSHNDSTNDTSAGSLSVPRAQQFHKAANKTDNGKSSRMKTKSEVQPTSNAISSVTSEDSTLTCVICANALTHAAVGHCDHPVCSTCAMRLRIKSREKNCPVCRSVLQLMIVCQPIARRQTSTGTVASEPDAFLVPQFSSWNIQSLDIPMPGCDIDLLSGLVFVDCKSHFLEMQALRSLQCPVPGCAQRMPSNAALAKHVKQAHNQQFCMLCLEHRTLFVSEQRLYSETQLKKHMESPPTEGDTLSGHPECQFCKKRYFDAMQLYAHMQQDHCTCPMCPGEHRFRFYQNPASLHAHLKSVHYVCEHCADIDSSLGPVAFGTAAEYASHLAAAHGQHRAPRALLSLASYGSNSSRSLDAYVDLDMSQADPNRPAMRVESHNRSGARLDEPVALVPPNMRVAGHVTGTGQFQRSAADEALERASEEAHARSAAGKLRQAGSLGGLKNGTASLHAFPNLSSGPVTERVNRPIPGTHSLSLVAQQAERVRQQREERMALEEQRAEAERRRLLRNQQLADSFGVTAPEAFAVEAAEKTKGTTAFADVLRRPLYTPNLVSWANKDLRELVKIERKIEQLIDTPAESSVQLKPMQSGPRAYVHALARYYGLSSYEFDQEPKRYISLVKVVDTSIPNVLLSNAAQERPFALHEGLRKQNVPILYLQLLNGYFASTSNEGPTTSTPSEKMAGTPAGVSSSNSGGRFWSGSPSVMHVVGAIRAAFRKAGVDADPSFGFVHVRPCGANGVTLEMRTIQAAALAHHLLVTEWQQRKSGRMTAAPISSNVIAGASAEDLHLLDLFELETGFIPGLEGEEQRVMYDRLVSSSGRIAATTLDKAFAEDTAVSGRWDALHAGTGIGDAALLLSRQEEQRRARQDWQAQIQATWDSSEDELEKIQSQKKHCDDKIIGSNTLAPQPFDDIFIRPLPWPLTNQAAVSNERVNHIDLPEPARVKLVLAPRTLPLPLPPVETVIAPPGASGPISSASEPRSGGIEIWKPRKQSSGVVAPKISATVRAERGAALLQAGGALAAEYAAMTLTQHRDMQRGNGNPIARKSLRAYLEGDSDEEDMTDPDKNYYECLLGPDGKPVYLSDRAVSRKANAASSASQAAADIDMRPFHLRVAEPSLGVTCQWICSKCTFINEDGSYCEMCQARQE